MIDKSSTKIANEYIQNEMILKSMKKDIGVQNKPMSPQMRNEEYINKLV